MPRGRKKEMPVSAGSIAIKSICKRMKKKVDASFIKVIDNAEDFERETFSFGYSEVDDASNCGGIPRGKLVEIFGPESSGKSYLSLKVMADAQKKGGLVCLFDIEQAFDPKWAVKQGLDLDPEKFIYFNEAISAEETLDWVEAVCREPKVAVVVVDSTAALIPKRQLEESIEKEDMALLARAMAKGCPKIVSACHSGDTLCIFINQIRENLKAGMFGDPTSTPGGKSLKFYSSMRLRVWPGAKVKAKDGKGEDVIVAKKSSVTFVKNKLGSPFGKALFEIVFDEMAKNPLVKMLKLAKSYAIVKLYKKEFYIHKDTADTKKNFNTETVCFPSLADWCSKNHEMTEKILEDLLEELEVEDDDEALKGVDPIIYEMKDNKELWKSPLSDVSDVSHEEIADKTIEEIKEEVGDQDEKPEIV